MRCRFALDSKDTVVPELFSVKDRGKCSQPSCNRRQDVEWVQPRRSEALEQTCSTLALCNVFIYKNCITRRNWYYQLKFYQFNNSLKNLRPEMIQHCHVSVRVVLVISIWWIFNVIPFGRRTYVLIEQRIFWLTFIVHGVKTYHLYIFNV